VLKLAGLVSLAMVAFAANSVLARLALGAPGAEPMGYTGLRLLSGAAALYLLLILRNRKAAPVAGSWRAAGALFAYAIFFSVAYLLLGAATGALILFASVQIGIIGWAVLQGDRPGLAEWGGLALALAGLAYLVSPGLVAPDPLGAALMAIAGLAWAAYTLLGRGSSSPLADTAGNFVRTAPVAALLIGAGTMTAPMSPAVAAYAVMSGVVASGLGYAIWYAALPHLPRVRAAVVQLTVPVIAAVGGVILIAEPLSWRLVIASAAILGGVAIALLASERRRRAASA